jgi:hypothetical protein
VSLANSSKYRQSQLYERVASDRTECQRAAAAFAERSAIDPFIVMDVMGEANARELSGDDIIHMDV